jgi:branched-chain amino acid transport system substrate-binding protein
VVGYSTIMAAVAGLKKAGDLDTEKLASSFEGLEFGTPLGKVKFRPQDHQSTMGAYVGKTALKDGKGIMVDFHYIDGADVQPSDADVKKWRPQD